MWRYVAILLAVGFASNVPAQSLDVSKLPGDVVDDAAAEVVGPWKNSSVTRPFVGAGYRAVQGKGHSATFKFTVPEDGNYQVLLAFPPGGNRDAKVPVIVKAADGPQTVFVNQRQAGRGPLGFQPLGEFRFEAGDTTVVISTEGTQDHVIADAVWLVTAGEFSALEVKPIPVASKPVDKLAKPAATDAKPDAAPPADDSPVFRKQPVEASFAKLTPEQLDQLLERHLGQFEAPLLDDESFLRRATLDLIGRQPTESELDALADGPAGERRIRAVERLLGVSEFGENWSRYWSDVIRFRVPQPELTFLNYDPFRVWLADELNRGTTWDEIVHRVLTATGKVSERPWATFVGFHQADKSRLASETTRVFLGVQIQCAECHDHKFIQMPRETFHHLAAYFTRTEAKLPWNDSSGIEVKSKTAGEYKMPGGKGEMEPEAFGGAQVDLGTSDLERRKSLAEWIVAPGNPYFAKAFVNHVWARLLGRGFCEPVDEIGLGAEPVLTEVHDAVARHFVATGYDVKDLMRQIVRTRAYQRSLRAGSPEKPFAEQLAVRLRGDEVFDSLVAAVDLPNVRQEQAKASGGFRFPPPPKSTRDLVNDAFAVDPALPKGSVLPTLPQAMFLMNNAQLQQQIDGRADSTTVLAKLLAAESDDAAAIQKLFRRVLARAPTDRERQIATEHLAAVKDRREAFEDLLWSLVNTAEFTTRR